MSLTVICPRCAGTRCEWSAREMYCEDCQLLDSSPVNPWRDRDTEELIGWWNDELRKHGLELEPDPNTDAVGANIENASMVQFEDDSTEVYPVFNAKKEMY